MSKPRMVKVVDGSSNRRQKRDGLPRVNCRPAAEKICHVSAGQMLQHERAERTVSGKDVDELDDVFRFHPAKHMRFSSDTRLCHVAVEGLQSHVIAVALSSSRPGDCKVRAGAHTEFADDSVTGDERFIAGRSFWVGQRRVLQSSHSVSLRYHGQAVGQSNATLEQIQSRQRVKGYCATPTTMRP